MVPNDDKDKFLELLESMPIVLIACKRTGISKASVYRWRETDPVFKKKYERALERGRETIVDHAESKLLKLVERESLGAIKFVLESNSDRYFKPRKARPAPPVQRFVHKMTYEIVDKRSKENEPPEITVQSPNPE